MVNDNLIHKSSKVSQKLTKVNMEKTKKNFQLSDNLTNVHEKLTNENCVISSKSTNVNEELAKKNAELGDFLEKGHNKLTQKTLEGNGEKVPRPIEQAATKQLIAGIPYNEPACVLVTKDKFKLVGLNCDPIVNVVYSKDEQRLLFYYEAVAKDLFPLLQAYYSMNPIVLQVILVKDPIDFLELVSKTRTAKGLPKEGYKNMGKILGCDGSPYDLYGKIGRNNSALKPGYVALNLENVARAYNNIPPQSGSAECSVNSAARALILVRANINCANYDNFVNKCPNFGARIKTVAKNTMKTGYGAGILGTMLSFLPGGAVVGVPLAVSGIGASAVGATGYAIMDQRDTARKFGVDPWDLSNHIDDYLPGNYKYSAVRYFDDFALCAGAIKQDMHRGDLVIAFFFFEPTMWHYANIVAVKENRDGKLEEFIMLDTNRKFESYTRYEMQFLMKNVYQSITALALWNHPGYNYYIIRFYKK